MKSQSHKKPRLILQITVDQLRGDLPGKYLDRYGEGGFKYLIGKGVVFMNAHYAHSNTETGVGHTALATGAYPSISGIIGNDWYNTETGKVVYCVEDLRYPQLQFADSTFAIKFDSVRDSGNPGRSPANIISSTFSDELKSFSAGKSRIFGISFKDRGAITLAGHAGKAFWFDMQTGNFVTSSYYYAEYPDWVRLWNRKKIANSYLGKQWQLMYDIKTYLYGDRDDQKFEISLPGFGRTFPHSYGVSRSSLFYSMVAASPAGDEILLDFAKELIDKENIGKDTITDFLSVSFSCTDYVGHMFSPSSLESEDNLLRLDKDLAGLFSYIDKKIGLNNTLIVLSADHGASEAPELSSAYGLNAGKFIMNDFLDNINDDLKARFGAGRELIRSYGQLPNIYLNHNLISEKNLSASKVEDFLIEKLQKAEGIYMAVSLNRLMKNEIVQDQVTSLIMNNYYNGRSGDIYLVSKPYWMMVPDRITLSYMSSTHGSPWNNDTFVPIIFAGNGVVHNVISREVYTVDIATTLSAVTGSKYPSGTSGKVLDEVINSQH